MEEKKAYEKARGEFFAAFISDFTYFPGAGEDMRDWEFLCDILWVRPAPQTVEESKWVGKGHTKRLTRAALCYILKQIVQTGAGALLHQHIRPV